MFEPPAYVEFLVFLDMYSYFIMKNIVVVLFCSVSN